TVTHGWTTPGGIVNGQPAIRNVSEARTRRPPPACARVLVVVAVTVPPCGHIRTLLVLSNAAKDVSPSRRRSSADHNDGRARSSPPRAPPARRHSRSLPHRSRRLNCPRARG